MRRSVLWSLGVVGILLFSALVIPVALTSAPASTGSASHAASSPLPFLNAPNAPAALKDLTRGSSAMSSAEASTYAAIQATLLSGAHQPTLQEELAAVTEVAPTYAANASIALAAPTPALSCGTTCALLSDAGAVTLVAVVCAATGVESLGIGCLAAVAIAVIILTVEYFLGLNAANNAAKAASTLGNALIRGAQTAYFTLAGSRVEIQSLINLTVQAFGYAAASAALLQIGNLTWNGPLDEVQSGLAANLSAEVAGFAAQETAILQSTMSSFSTSLGTLDASGYGCPAFYKVAIGNLSPTIRSGTGTSLNACGGSTTSVTSEPYGTGQLGGAYNEFYVENPTVGSFYYISPGAEIFGSDSGSGSVTLWSPLNNATVHVHAYATNFSMPAGSEWRVNATTGSFLCSICFALNTASESDISPTPYTVIEGNAAANNEVTPSGTFDILYAGTSLYTGGSAGPCVPYGDLAALTSTACPADNYLGTGSALLWDEEFAESASAIGQTYWSFLHLLGYFSLSAIPGKCIIPSPNTAFQGIPYTEIQGANVSYLLNFYLTYLRSLGYTYNSTDFVLNTTTFCDHPLPPPSGNLTGQFSTYGLGYLFVNGTGKKNANGTASQVFGNPTTWNASGEIFLQPTLYSMTFSVNTTWLLSSKQVAWAFVTPLSNSSTSGKTVANGPTVCATTGNDCFPYVPGSYLLGTVAGNSSLKGGGTLTTALVPGRGLVNDSVYMVECFVDPTPSVAGSTFHQTSTCGFNVSSITPPPPPCTSQCGGGGGLGGGAGTTCGAGIWLFGTVVNDINGLLGGGSGILGGISCAVAWVIGLLVTIVLIVVVIWAIAAVVRVARGR